MSQAEMAAAPIALKPLAILGVIVAKAEVVEALKVYVPQLEDILVFEDGEQFYLKLRPASEE